MLLLPAAVLDAVRGATTACVGGAAIHLARSVSAMLDADAASVRKRGAACRRAHCLATTAMLAARSFRCRSGGSAATAERAEPKGAVFHAEPTSLSTCTALCSRADLLPTMLPANPPYFCVVAAAFGRAGHSVGMLVAHTSPVPCVGGAPRHCAGPMRTVFAADA